MEEIIRNWTPLDVYGWIRSIGLDNAAEFFEEHGIDGSTLLMFTKEDLFYLAKVFYESILLREMVVLHKALEELKVFKFGFGDEPISELSEPQEMSNEAKWKEGGLEKTIRLMEDTFPDYCWRYKSIDALVKDFMPANKVAERKSDLLNPFPALVSYLISPVEFYVQPDMIREEVDKLHDKLQQAYSESIESVPPQNIFVGMPCVARYNRDGKWYRAQVIDGVGADDASVKFVDWGNRQYSSLTDLKPLKHEFGRLPPMALKCRIEGVRERTLEQKVLNKFRDELEDIDDEIMAAITSSVGESYLVQIYKKDTMENIGQKYLPKEPICPVLPAAALEYIRRCERKRAEYDDYGEVAATSGEGQPAVFMFDIEDVLEGNDLDYSSSDDGQIGEIRRINKHVRKICHQERLMAQSKLPSKSKSIKENKKDQETVGITKDQEPIGFNGREQ